MFVGWGPIGGNSPKAAKVKENNIAAFFIARVPRN
jgi:hypothetical protein